MGLAITNPTHEPHEKKGEQPVHSFSGVCDLGVSFAEELFKHTSSEQQGFAESTNTHIDNIKQMIFTPVKVKKYYNYKFSIGN